MTSQYLLYYPDVVLTCYPNDGDKRTVENLRFVVEVLLESTANIDRIEKLEAYQRIASVRQYVLID
jgi:Uma2 family endonuclease